MIWWKAKRRPLTNESTASSPPPPNLSPHQVIAERIMDLGTDRVPPLLLLPLFSNLSSDQQSKAFEAAEKAVRKCVVSTNIAETSVTVRCLRCCL